MTKYLRKHLTKQLILVGCMSVVLLMTFVTEPNNSLAAEEKKSDEKVKQDSVEQDSYVSGEVKSIRAFEGNLLLVLVEWPVVIKLDSNTVFKGKSGQKVSIYSAKELLVGQAVKILKKTNENGEFVAEKILILDYEDLQKLKKLRPERMKQHSNKNKDATK